LKQAGKQLFACFFVRSTAKPARFRKASLFGHDFMSDIQEHPPIPFIMMPAFWANMVPSLWQSEWI
jgi:hypothetical protein